MNKEQIKQAVQEFFESNNPTSGYMDFAVKFLQSMIFKSLIFDLDHVSDLRTEIIMLSERVEQLQQTNQQVGEVTDKELKQYFDNHTDCFADAEGNIYPIPAMTYNQIVKLAKWLIQFKTTATPVKDISKTKLK